ncbi:hypothetical protein, partial [Nocardia farcinica]|uniref:hypothetical protein n=1 Tax=Nocardia farcinica TaxID=37329 RepID=UPI002454F9C3
MLVLTDRATGFTTEVAPVLPVEGPVGGDGPPAGGGGVVGGRLPAAPGPSTGRTGATSVVKPVARSVR